MNLAPRPLDWIDLKVAAQSSWLLWRRNLWVYLPISLICVVLVFSAKHTPTASLTPLFYLFMPLVCLVITIYDDNNIEFKISGFINDIISINRWYVINPIMITGLVALLMINPDLIIASIESFIGWSALSESEQKPDMFQQYFAFGAVLSIGMWFFMSLFAITYLRIRFALDHRTAKAKSENLTALNSPLIGTLSDTAVVMVLVFGSGVPLIMALLPIASNFQYFCLKAMFEGSAHLHTKVAATTEAPTSA